MEDDLKILQDIIQNEYNNNKNIQFNDVRITEFNNTLYFCYSTLTDEKEITEEELFKMDVVLDLVVGKMHEKDVFAHIAYIDLANNIYEPIYKLYKEYIKENNYYV